MTEVQLEQNQEEKKWARRAHLSTILTYPMALLPFPFLSLRLVQWFTRLLCGFREINLPIPPNNR